MVTVNYTLGHCSSEYVIWQVMMFLVIVLVSKSTNPPNRMVCFIYKTEYNKGQPLIHMSLL